MKNIHILQTDKPSRLHFTEFFEELVFTPKYEKLDGVNIYITSPNANINENDYIITKDVKLVQVSYLLSKDLEGASKVILTTDPQLIAEGVQAIDDEFLEWFCKNPSCEVVETEKVECQMWSLIGCNKDDVGCCGKPFKGYKIKEPKQETPEEAVGKKAIEYCKQYTGTDKYNVSMLAIEFGYHLALEQKERSYSEEDMKSFADWVRNGLLNIEYSVDKLDKHLQQWEQFKKK